jgi:hypothetical protein
LTDSTVPRVMRAYTIQPLIDSTTMMVVMLGPIAARITSASSRPGKATWVSTTRMITESNRPPR